MDRAIERQRLLLEHLRPSSTSSSLENLDSSISVSLSSHRPGQKVLLNSWRDCSKAIRVVDSLLSQSYVIQDICKRANCYSQLELHKHLINDCDKALKLDPTLLQAYILKVHAAFRISKLNAYCGAIGTKHPMNLGGYGVELALKNMEYKAMDDSEIKKGVTLKDRHTEDLRQEVRGFIFSKILERKPELTSEIMAFRDSLLPSAMSDTLNVWELKDLTKSLETIRSL
ncbi:hypothetical protein L2E82_13761 [Cichorium intybus]|uniref:Uncharacterized protein n=1 Tax=Cichorium intybus TaxID=13427 RepID=A0ACB9EXJ5_CICIN|nr:hypothetical protein L2E82_13761 [Cichorium intybus]